MGIRAAATGRLMLENVKLPAGALLGEPGRAGTIAECVQLGRLGWCALAVGTGQAVLDYLIPYVNERKAFGEPISHRQAVAFTVANVAIELDGMRLATYRAASRVDQGLDFAREVAAGPAACAQSGAWRSAPTASRCSAATGTSRSTRSSAGTATCGPPA